MAHLTGEPQPVASASCAIGAIGLAAFAFQLHKIRTDEMKGWTEMDMHKLWYFQFAWATSAFAFFMGIPRYVALMTIENYHMIHGPVVIMSAATCMAAMCHAIWMNINGEIAYFVTLFPWTCFFMLTSKEWRGQAAGAAYSVLFAFLLGAYGAHISKVDALKNAMVLFFLSYFFVVLHPDLNAGYSNYSLAGPLQVAGAKMILDWVKRRQAGEMSVPVQFPPGSSGEQQYYY